MLAFRNKFKEMIIAYSYKKASDNEPFVLASGKKSMHYFDLKQTIFLPEGFALMSNALWEYINHEKLLGKFEGIGGMTMGADPIVYAMIQKSLSAGYSIYPMIVRKENKDHGSKKLVEGYTERCQRVLAVDDVVTTAGSLIRSIESMRQMGCKIEHAISILDRNEGGRLAVNNIGVELHSLFSIHDFG